MTCLLDTSVAVSLLEDDDRTLHNVENLEGPLLLSVVSQVELAGGLAGPGGAARAVKLATFLRGVDVVDFKADSAAAYEGIIRAVGFSRRKVLDRMIAAQALVHRATLVTLNADDFRDVPGLDLLEW
ncbi:type II toxin-antitoxin system VapC family toxin [soil metagenome]